jgi:hypothetical protein
MHNGNNPTFLTNRKQKNVELNSAVFSIVKNLPFLPYRRSVDLLTDRERVAKWPEGAEWRDKKK